MTVPSMGVLAHLGFAADTTSTPATPTEEIEFLSAGLSSSREIIRREGIRGSRLHPKERVRQGRLTPGGSFSFDPTPDDLGNWLPRIVAAASAQAGYSTYTVSDTVPVYFQSIADYVARVQTLTGCKVDRARFHAVAGQPLSLDVDVEALNLSEGAAGSVNWSSINALSTTAPYVFEDGALTLASTTYNVMEFDCTIDWHLKKDRWVNSLTRTDLPSMDFTCTARFVVEYTADTYALRDAGVSGVTGRMDFSVGGSGQGSTGKNLRFDFANLIFPANRTPTVPGRDEITLTLEGESRRSGTTSPLIVSNDLTA